jgi:nucleoid-associated protein YgaU
MSGRDAPSGGTAALEKLTIWYQVKAGPLKKGSYKTIQALFNPSQLRYDNRAEWRATGTIAQSVAGGFQRMEFQATPPATLNVDLFFDTYEGAPETGTGSLRTAPTPDNSSSAGTPSFVNVKRYTQEVAKLAHVQSELHRPPVCRLQWGKTVLFEGVLTQLQQDFTFFMPDGTPVRATLSCTFTAYRTFDQAVTEVELHSADVAKRRIVSRGDTLDSIAIEEYGDGTRWRAIASENEIDNPRALAPGQVLVIPKLTA